MTMQNMVEHLESLGFETTKTYENKERAYRFKISKNDFHVSSLFVYPSDDDPKARDTKQREFLGFIVNMWTDDYKYHCQKLESAQGMRPEQKVWITTAGRDNTFYIGTMLNDNVVKVKGENNMPTKEEQFYIRQDVDITRALYTKLKEEENRRIRQTLFGIKNVIFSGPCTIVLWEDGTKTVVRCEKDEFDQEKGLAMAIAKKALGTNKSGSNYYDIFKKWLPKSAEE